MWLAEDNTIHTKPPISKQHSLKQEKQESINQRALSEERKGEKNSNISHIQHRTPSIPNPVLTKREECEQIKKEDSTPEGRKGKKS